MVKLIGAVMTGFACAYLGFRARLTLKTRQQSLSDINISLQALESEINFSVNRLKKAFERADRNGLFARAAERLEEQGARGAWCGAVRETSVKLCLTDADCDALMTLGASIGKTDTDDQIKNIRYVRNLVAAQLQQANEDYRRLGKLYSGGGVLLGALVVIVLL